MSLRIKNIRTRLKKERLDGLIVSSAANISYLTKYRSRDSYLLITGKQNIYFTDSRYIEEATLKLRGICKIEKIDGPISELMAEACSGLKLKAIGFEARNISFAEFKKIRRGLKKTKLVPTDGLVEELRQIKEQEELRKIRKAIAITAKALKFIKSFIKPGRKEIEVVGELERFIRYQGASSSAFDIVVASGPNSSFPHHISGARKIRDNEPVLVDIGVDYQGYKSDLTRIFFLGKINILAPRIYDIVLEAQNQALKRISPGVAARDVDAAGRQYIAAQGYGKLFGHSLGHGVGLEVHEKPRISGKQKLKLEPGQVFTVEPAIYLPGRFGIRLEDMVLVTEKGCEVLSGAINK